MKRLTPIHGRELIRILCNKFGFTRYEVSLYVAMLTRGPSSYARLVEVSSVPYGRFYDVAERLVKKGFAEVIPGRPKLFKATPPYHAVTRYLNNAKTRILRSLDKEIVATTM